MQRQKDAWKAMAPFWATVDPLLIDKDMARAYARRRGRSDATVRYELGMLAVALRWAADGKKLRTAPEIWRPAPPERKERHLTHEQFERFYAAVRAPHARLYVMLAIYTMARPAAILDLTWDRVDFDAGMIDLNPRGRRQTAKRRPVLPMADDLLSELREAYKARTIDHVVERGGKPVANIKKAFQAASARCGIHVTPYMLRHTGAVWAAEGGAPMAELAQFMGHEDSATTEKHYARFSPGYLRRVANTVQRKKLAPVEVQ